MKKKINKKTKKCIVHLGIQQENKYQKYIVAEQRIIGFVFNKDKVLHEFLSCDLVLWKLKLVEWC